MDQVKIILQHLNNNVKMNSEEETMYNWLIENGQLFEDRSDYILEQYL